MILEDSMQESRKRDHIELTKKSQTPNLGVDERFYYEPLLAAHPADDFDLSIKFLNKKMQAPFWISSMTGGVGEARHINQNLAKVAREFSLGMGLGSCRALLESNQYFEDFNLRPILGDELPFYANLGIAQLEDLIGNNELTKIFNIVERLSADGLIIHVNPLQEWFQPEGDRFLVSPIETIKKVVELKRDKKIIVKEVGQGMGPKSLLALLQLDIDAIELAAFGGTNFSKLEALRQTDSFKLEELVNVGHSALEMVHVLNHLAFKHHNFTKKDIIISGGIKNALDAHYLMSLLKYNSVVGMAHQFLSHAESYESLFQFTKLQIESLKMARSFLTVKKTEFA